MPRLAPTRCTGCGTSSRCRHGSYERTVADLPWQGRPVRLRLRLRRLRCLKPTCPGGPSARAWIAPSLTPAGPSGSVSSNVTSPVQRHLISRPTLRLFRAEAADAWQTRGRRQLFRPEMGCSLPFLRMYLGSGDNARPGANVPIGNLD
ncbi:transposase family protein [Methylorubrum extorquens]